MTFQIEAIEQYFPVVLFMYMLSVDYKECFFDALQGSSSFENLRMKC